MTLPVNIFCLVLILIYSSSTSMVENSQFKVKNLTGQHYILQSIMSIKDLMWYVCNVRDKHLHHCSIILTTPSHIYIYIYALTHKMSFAENKWDKKLKNYKKIRYKFTLEASLNLFLSWLSSLWWSICTSNGLSPIPITDIWW